METSCIETKQESTHPQVPKWIKKKRKWNFQRCWEQRQVNESDNSAIWKRHVMWSSFAHKPWQSACGAVVNALSSVKQNGIFIQVGNIHLILWGNVFELKCTYLWTLCPFTQCKMWVLVNWGSTLSQHFAKKNFMPVNTSTFYLNKTTNCNILLSACNVAKTLVGWDVP